VTGKQAQQQGVQFLAGVGIFLLFATMSRLALGSTQPLIHCVLGTLALGLKQLGHEADHSCPSSAEVKNEWSYTSTLPNPIPSHPTICLRGVVPS